MVIERADFDKKELREAIIKSIGGKRLQKVGNSLAIYIPRLWADANATELDGVYYVKFRWVDAKTMQIEPIDPEELKGLFEVNSVQLDRD